MVLSQNPPELRVRKNLLALSEQEILDLQNAFRLLYEDPQQPYQRCAEILPRFGHTDRNDLLFLPWARAYFNTFEKLLQAQVPTVTLPYWDYTSETSQSEGVPSFVAEPLTAEGEPNPLYRGEWTNPLHTFRETQDPSGLAGAAALAEAAFGNANFVSFSTSIWLVDIASHTWIGGSAGSVETTSFDPLFWFSHCNLDRFWDAWQRQYNDYTLPPSVGSAKLRPFRTTEEEESRPLTGNDVVRTADLGYTYL
jgi:tyrosinase